MNPQPVGLASDLAPLQVMRSTVGHHDVAVWRSTRGVVSAWENRCPHRGMRLSYGFVRGESLACAYHGWHYNCSGQCHYIPAHPELTPPQSIRPTIFSVTEHAGLLWVDTSCDTQLDPEDGISWPATSLAELPQDLHPLRTLSFDCELDTLIRTLSDVTAPGNSSEKATIKSISEKAGIKSLDALGIVNGIYLVLHTPSSQPILVHVLVDANLSVENQILVSRWCESLRRRAESL